MSHRTQNNQAGRQRSRRNVIQRQIRNFNINPQHLYEGQNFFVARDNIINNVFEHFEALLSCDNRYLEPTARDLLTCLSTELPALFQLARSDPIQISASWEALAMINVILLWPDRIEENIWQLTCPSFEGLVGVLIDDGASSDYFAKTIVKCIACLGIISLEHSPEWGIKFLDWLFDILKQPLPSPSPTTPVSPDMIVCMKGSLFNVIRDFLHPQSPLKSPFLSSTAYNLLLSPVFPRILYHLCDLFNLCTNNNDLFLNDFRFSDSLNLLEALRLFKPPALAEVFTNIIPPLLRIHLHPATPSNVVKQITNVFAKLTAFWGANQEFTVTILSSLLDEMEYVCGVTAEMAIPSSFVVSNHLPQLPTRVRFLSESIYAILEPFLSGCLPHPSSKDPSPPISKAFQSIVYRVVRFTIFVRLNYSDSNEWRRMSKRTLNLLIAKIPDQFIAFQYPCVQLHLTYIPQPPKLISAYPLPNLQTWFRDLLNLLQSFNRIDIRVATILLCSRSPLCQLKWTFAGNQGVLNDLSKVVRSVVNVLSTSSISNVTDANDVAGQGNGVEETIRNLLMDIQIEIVQLLKMASIEYGKRRISKLKLASQLDIQSCDEENQKHSEIHPRNHQSEKIQIDIVSQRFPLLCRLISRIKDSSFSPEVCDVFNQPTQVSIADVSAIEFSLLFDLLLLRDIVSLTESFAARSITLIEITFDFNVRLLVEILARNIEEYSWGVGLLEVLYDQFIEFVHRHYQALPPDYFILFTLPFVISPLSRQIRYKAIHNIGETCSALKRSKSSLGGAVIALRSREIFEAMMVIEGCSLNLGDVKLGYDVAELWLVVLRNLGCGYLKQSCLELLMKRLNDTDPGIRIAYMNVLASLDPLQICHQKPATALPIYIRMFLRYAHQSPHSGSFRPAHFRIAMQSLNLAQSLPTLDYIEVKPCSTETTSWLERLYHTCQGPKLLQPYYLEAKNVLPSAPDISTEILSFIASVVTQQANVDVSGELLTQWCVWEASRYCILSRLKTPLGGPAQTFEAFERALKDCLAKEIVPMTDTSLEAGSSVLNVSTTLLFLIDLLRKQIYNAAVGTTYQFIPSAPKSAIQFFRANFNACSEWQHKIRMNVVKLALKIGNWSLVVQEGFLLVQSCLLELGKLLSGQELDKAEEVIQKLEEVVVSLVDGIQRLEEPDVLVGLFVQLHYAFRGFYGVYGKGVLNPTTRRRISPVSWEWLKGSIMMAKGRYEAAINEYYKHLMIKTLPPQTKQFLTRQVNDCYLALQSESVDKWFDLFPQLECPDEWTKVQHESLKTLSQFSDTPSADLNDGCLPALSSVSDISIFSENAILTATRPTATPDIDSLLAQAQRVVTSPLFVMTPDKRHSSEHLLAAQLLRCVKDVRDGNVPVLVVDEIESSDKFSNRTGLKVLHIAGRILSSAPTHIEDIWKIRDSIFTGSRKSLNFASCEALLSAYESNNRFLFGSFIGHHFEKAKLAFAMGKYQKAIDSLLELTMSTEINKTGGDRVVQAKVYSKLAKWVQTVKWNPDVNNDEPIQRIIASGVEKQWVASESATLTADTVSQNALLLASQIYSTDPKIWFDYATYCYRKASKLLDVIVSPYTGSVVFEIAPELKSIVETVPGTSVSDKGIPEKLRKCLVALLAHLGGGGFTDWSGDGLSPLEWVKQQEVFADSSQFDLVVTEFERLWKRIVDTLEGSLRGYFVFLKLHGGNDCQSTRDSDKSYDAIAATLRILRILWNSGSVFEHVFKAEFASTAVSSWKAVIPQLFARLDHPDAFVRSQLTELLAQLASEFPQFVLYHAIVGSTSATNAAEYKASLLQIQSRLDDSDGLVASTQVVVDELLKVTVLWEEVWLNKLSQLQADVSKRFQKLDAEMSRLKEDTVMSKSDKEKAVREMYSVVMKPVVVDLEKMCNNYLRRCSTPHEEWFQKTYGGRIQSALDSLMQPKANRDIKSGWQEFSELYREFNRGLHRNRVLKLSNVNPSLMKLKNTPVLMPGVFDSAEPVTIKSFEPDFVVLATKTKPKKMTLTGSDGRTYRYLCKGVEDLHLDERIMQFMTTINHLLQRDRQTASRNLRARNYAVIPLGDQSGMIQWVDNATPAYTIFKKWQTNELEARLKLFPNQEGNQPTRETIAKPNELLYQKVAKIFKREGINKAVSRRNCTPEVLLEAHKELVKDTPSDLISRELWCSSVTPLDYFRKNLSISRSLAVMSMIGYIIGLGDRHLDNILIDFDQSEIIHIDYNICFERGKKLRVPEMVPFRLTQNFVDVLGVTGVEGTFRIACESVLTALRKHREVLTTLLETFVYDPLVDWNDDMKDDREKKLLEINVNLGLLASRIGEMWNPLEVARSSVVEALSSLDNIIGTVVAQSQSQSTEDNKQDEMYEICGQLRNEVEVFTTLFAQIRSLLNSLIEISEDLEEAKTLQVQAKDVISSFDKFISESNMLLDAVELAEEGGQDTYQEMRRLVSSISEQVDSLFADINLLCSVTPLEISITPPENSNTKHKPVSESVVSPTSQAQATVPTDSKSPIIGTDLSQRGTQTGQSDEKLTQDFQNQLSSLEKQMSGLYLHEIEEQERSNEHQDEQKSKQNGDGGSRDNRDKRDNRDDGDDMELELPAQPVHQYKKNVHALEVLKRIKVKLDGRDNETNKRVGVQEQVDMVIRQATDLGNLSLMYEGWTPWV